MRDGFPYVHGICDVAWFLRCVRARFASHRAFEVVYSTDALVVGHNSLLYFGDRHHRLSLSDPASSDEMGRGCCARGYRCDAIVSCH